MSPKRTAEVIQPGSPNWRTDVLLIGLPGAVMEAARGRAALWDIDADYITTQRMPEQWGLLQSIWMPPRMDTVAETVRHPQDTPYSRAPLLPYALSSFQAPTAPEEEVLQVMVQRWGPQRPAHATQDFLVVHMTCDLPPSTGSSPAARQEAQTMGMWGAFEALKQPGGDFDLWMKMWNQDAHKKKLSAGMLEQVPTQELARWIFRLNAYAHLQNGLPTPAAPKLTGRL